jgi:hypothetical protein
VSCRNGRCQNRFARPLEAKPAHQLASARKDFIDSAQSYLGELFAEIDRSVGR